jgi:hypothetical protein
MTETTPNTEQPNLPMTSGSQETPPDSADQTPFFSRVQRELKPKPHPTQEQEIVVEMTPEKDEQT